MTTASVRISSRGSSHIAIAAPASSDSVHNSVRRSEGSSQMPRNEDTSMHSRYGQNTAARLKSSKPCWRMLNATASSTRDHSAY